MTTRKSFSVHSQLTSQKVCQLINDGKVNDLPIILQNCSPNGNVASLTSVGTSEMWSCVMDSTHVVVAYKNTSNSRLEAFVITISGTTMTAGTACIVDTMQPQYISICKLDDTHVVAIYEDQTNSPYKCKSVVMVVSGTTLSAGTPVYITTKGCNYTSICKIDSTHVVAVYGNMTDSKCDALVLTISGTSITTGTILSFSSGLPYYLSACMLDSTHVFVAYRPTCNSTMYGSYLMISGTTIIEVTSTLLINNASMSISVGVLDSTHAFVAYVDATNNPYVATAFVVTIKNNVITVGSSTAIGLTPPTSYLSAIVLKEDTAMVAYTTNTNDCNVIILDIAGSLITVTQAIVVSQVTPYTLNLCLVDSTTVFLVFVNSASPYVCKSQLFQYSTLKGVPVGMAQDNLGSVILKGSIKGLSGLSAGSKYYYNSNGELTNAYTDTFLGIALSDTELYIPDYISK